VKERKFNFRNRKNKIKKSKVGLKKEKKEQSWPEEKKRKAKSTLAHVTGPELWAGK